MAPDGVEWDTLLWGYVRSFQAVLDGFPAGTVVRYRLSIESSQGEETFADGGDCYGIYIDNDPLPEWARDAIVYQVFVDRFNPGSSRTWNQTESLSDFYGGTLNGITEKLDYIASLSVDTLWLTPIFASPTHHGYDATDLLQIEPRYGTPDDLRRLLDAAHERGMRVLLDLVPNHWSDQHVTFQDALNNPNSQYKEWYLWNPYPQKYESFFGVRSLPQINLRNPAARAHLLDATAHWLTFGVDGYRLDYAIGPTPDFWADFRKVTRQANPACWTFGEVVDPSDRQLAFEGQLDGCLDFVLLEAIRQTFAFRRWMPERFASFLDRHEGYFPASFSRPSFLDNHDMNRFLWACNGDERRLRLAALCQFTLAGPPVIYYGTETGVLQERDVRQGALGIPEESRQPMNWDGMNHALLDWYRGLGALRKSRPSLSRGTRQMVQAQDGVFAYLRQIGSERSLIALNLSDEEARLDVNDGWGSVVFATEPATIGTNLTGESSINLPPLGGVVIE